MLAAAEVLRRVGDEQQALHSLTNAARAFEAADMPLHAALARRRSGQLLGGQEGAALGLSADSYLRSQGIKQPSRWATLLIPGFRD